MTAWDEDALLARSRALGQGLLRRGWTVTTAESCTGGGVAAAITATPGSSGWFEQGFVTYSNAAKQQCLGVPSEVLAEHGAVSAETVAAMAQGACRQAGAHLAVSVSGIAGPDGATPGKPVGTVWFGWADLDGRVRTDRQVFPGDRQAVRRAAVLHALEGLLEWLERG